MAGNDVKTKPPETPSTGTVPGVAAGSALLGTGAEAGTALASITAAQASAAIAMAAQVEMAKIQNAIALNEAMCHVQEEIGKGVKSLAQ